VSGSGQQLSVALLSMGAIALGATTYLGSPWPGVVLCGLSLVPWGWEAWLSRGEGTDRHTTEVMAGLLAEHGAALVQANKRIEEQGQQINSLRNAVSLRGHMGG
jgi:hypothetical protein